MRDDRRHARVATLLSFSSFFVFPAIPVGRTGAITIPIVLAAVLAALWIRRLRAPEWLLFAWMMAPLVVSGACVVLIGSALTPGVVAKIVVMTAAEAFLIVLPARHLLRRGYGEQFVLGAAYAILVHAAIGAWQMYAFERGEFPLADLMRTNPGMALLTEDTPTYVEYVKRPFGLFAEPSAMGACVGPWLVLITSALFARRSEGSRHRPLLALALASGLALVVASKSGLAAPIAAGTAITALGAALSWRRGLGTRAAALFMSAAIAVASAVWLTRNAGSRFDLAHNDSWQSRLESLRLAVKSLAESSESVATFLVGVGPGQSFAALSSTQLKYETAAGVTAVWSVGLNYAMETGALGIIGMLALAAVAAGSIWASRARLAGAMFALVWLSGVSFGTSYVGQPAMWTALAALLSWRYLAPGEARSPAAPAHARDAIGRRPGVDAHSRGADLAGAAP